jgi:hypothetical protein
MAVPRLTLHFADPDALAREYETNLSRGRAFVPAVSGVPLMCECELCLVHPVTGAALCLPARSLIELGGGIGLELAGDAALLRQRLDRFLATGTAPAGPAQAETPPAVARREAAREPAGQRLAALRCLPVAEQLQLARGGDLEQRTALERLYGVTVWEALLRNPRITVAEVARIARKGTVPQVLLELIVDNAAWLRAGPVRRALLGNPRLPAEAVARVLRQTPRPELRLAPRQTAYPQQVREAARRLLRELGEP